MHTGRFVTTHSRLVPKLFHHLTCKLKLDGMDPGVMARVALALRCDHTQRRHGTEEKHKEERLMQKEAEVKKNPGVKLSATRRPLEARAVCSFLPWRTSRPATRFGVQVSRMTLRREGAQM